MESEVATEERAIGGFFELEIPKAATSYHLKAMALSTGRACLVAYLGHMKPSRAFLPHYTCDATLAPFKTLDVEICFYELDDKFSPVGVPALKNDDCLVMTNYWGLQRDIAVQLGDRFQDQLIVDNTHDFFWQCDRKPFWSFTSARKWFGVPDGAYLYAPTGLPENDILPDDIVRNNAISLQHAVERRKGNQQHAFLEYQEYERTLGVTLRRISTYSESLLSHVDMTSVAQKRKRNFETLEARFESTNQLAASLRAQTEAIPFAYPYVPRTAIARERLHSQNIYVPQLWTDVLNRKSNHCLNSKRWSNDLLPLPIDHRYGHAAMQRIANAIEESEGSDER